MTEFIIEILGNITNIIEQYSYLIIFLLMVIESSFIPFPSELVMIPAGFLVAQGKLSFSLVILSGILGSVCGALLNYYLAKILGIRFLNRFGKYILINEKKLIKIQSFFTSHGAISTFTGRLIPGVRQYISIPAGICEMNIKKFIFYTFLGSAIWMAILTILGFIFGENQQLLTKNLTEIIYLIFATIISLIIIYTVRYKKGK